MPSPTQHKHTNRLANETSPYLLQHAHNPVDWHAWGPEALRKAKAEGKPILLSIGYSSCHWCHVMERESFEDEATAALMNRDYVSIKVDREERPDLDEIYMAATVAMNQGRGGWPMTVFLDTDLQPFFAGTYFPPQDRQGLPGFKTVLTQLATLWQTDRARLKEAAGQVTAALQRQFSATADLEIGERELGLAVEQYAQEFDATYGGFGDAPKFPPATGLSFLLRDYRRTGNPRSLEMVRKTLDAMARGGIYDQLGGGFARYSTDQRWLVPHFEKMLYDNAHLAKAYLEAFQVTADPFYARIARETLDYVLREMTSPEGAFYSATDADSEGEEGKYFVWTARDIRDILGDQDARLFSAYFDISEIGNWEEKNILNTPRSLEDTGKALGVTVQEMERVVDEGKRKLYEARQKRVPPGLDDKVLTAWNGMMIGALAEGYRVLGEERYLNAARRAADFLLATLVKPDGRLLRTYRAGKAHLDAYLEDYAYLFEALIDLYEAVGSRRYLDEAARLAALIMSDFADDVGGAFYATAKGHESLIARPREGTDGATPSANAVAASALARFSYHLGREDLRVTASSAIKAYGKMIARAPRAFAKSLIALGLLLEGPVELALVGKRGSPDFEALAQEIRRHYLPNRIQALYDPSIDDASGLPLLEGKTLVGGKAALYVCRNFACAAPVTEPSQVAAALHERRDTSAPVVLSGRKTSGHVTPEGTHAYAQRFLDTWPHGYIVLGSTGLTTSKLGFGGYRVDEETAEHAQALELALTSGCNLIDTSTNYTDGSSERLIGATIAKLVRSGALRRDEVVVVSKIGYVQGQNLELAHSRETEGRPFPEMVKYMEGLWHCLHPMWLEDQLARSLERLRLETLDVCLLHNPEYFFSDAAHHRGGDLGQLRAEFYRRLKEAFAFFEGQVASGKLRWYGVSSNNVGHSPTHAEATSLSRMLEAARQAGGPQHHFRVLQLPMNLLEPGGFLQANTGPGDAQTALAHAIEQQVGVLVNRPLNAIVGNSMLRLADVNLPPPGPSYLMQLPVVAHLESEFLTQIAPSIQTPPNAMPATEYFRWADQFQDILRRIQGNEQWQQIKAQVVYWVTQIAQALNEGITGPLKQRWESWFNRYLPELEKLTQAVAYQVATKAQVQAMSVAQAIDPLLPEERRRESLSRKALWVLASTPGVSCVLNGMRTPTYVNDSLGIMAWPALSAPTPVYEAMKAFRPNM